MIFETTSKFLIAFLKLILGKKGYDGFTELQREYDVRYEFDFKVDLEGLGSK